MCWGSENAKNAKNAKNCDSDASVGGRRLSPRIVPLISYHLTVPERRLIALQRPGHGLYQHSKVRKNEKNVKSSLATASRTRRKSQPAHPREPQPCRPKVYVSRRVQRRHRSQRAKLPASTQSCQQGEKFTSQRPARAHGTAHSQVSWSASGAARAGSGLPGGWLERMRASVCMLDRSTDARKSSACSLHSSIMSARRLILRT
jgi:hypothetical protein